LLAAVHPLNAGASTSSGDLSLSPAHGAPGSHFQATFTFTEAPCSEYAVYFYWDPPNPALELGGVDATGAGPTCQVSVTLTVPSTDADPNRSYPVLASAQTKQVDAGNGSATTGSTKDSGSSEFQVTSSPAGGSVASSSPPIPRDSSPGAGSTAPVARSTPGTSESTSGTTGATTSAASSPSSAPGTTSAPTSGSSSIPPLAIEATRTGGSGGAIVVAAAVLAVLIVGGLVYRAGGLNVFRRR
jgi:hypothetical protein